MFYIKLVNELPISAQQEISTYQLIYNELLKHFWFYIPITNDEYKENLDKLVKLLKNTEEKFNEFHLKLLEEYQNIATSSKEVNILKYIGMIRIKIIIIIIIIIIIVVVVVVVVVVIVIIIISY